MIVKDLQGNSHKISFSNAYQNVNRPARSSFHLEARNLLKQTFPSILIIEEVSMPIRKGQTLYFDFFLPILNLLVEVQGHAHYTEIGFFHKSQSDFLKQQKRDAEKRLWAEINGFDLIELRFDEQDKWQEQLQK